MMESNRSMNWERLIVSARWNEGLSSKLERTEADDSRNPFERDYGRILYSWAFRRLQDKTQVFPLGRNDYVRTRLTHSLEVSYVGRSLGEALGNRLADGVLAGTPLESQLGAYVGAAVASACLAHDIGNPPFGHAGEKAIESAFAKRGFPIAFEGNAQGFRLLTKIGGDSMDGFGLKLTAGTLGAFMKYPCSESFCKAVKSDELVFANKLECKKFSFADTEIDAARFVADACGLPVREDAGTHFAFARHPFAFLVEAADDLSYLVADLEDAFNTGIVAYADAKKYLRKFWKNAEDCAKIEARLKKIEKSSRRSAVNYMRATAIGQGIRAANLAFKKRENLILRGEQEKSLFDDEANPLCNEIRQLRKFSRENIYRATSVESIELMGFQVVQSLADFLLDWVDDPASAKSKKMASVFKFKAAKTDDAKGERLLEVADYISGMTDSFALATYHKLNGIVLA